jgi:L-amino acid N-acyltransferase YncA
MIQNAIKPEDSFSGNQLRTVISGIAAAHCVSVSLHEQLNFKLRDSPIDISEKYQSAYGHKLALLEWRR